MAKNLSLTLAAVLLAVAAVRADAAIVNWPVSDDDWTPLLIGGNPYTDPTGEVSPKNVDIVGTADVSAGFWHFADNGTPVSSDDELLFRLRISKGAANSQPYPNNLGNYVWQVLFDIDGDSDIDWSLQVDNSGDNEVELVDAIVGGPTFDDIELNTTATWSGALTDYSRLTDPTGDGEHIGSGTADAFLDFGIPWDEFAAATGITPKTPFRAQLASSASHSTNNKDHPLALPGSGDVAAGFADVIVVPEPSTWVMLALALVLICLWRRKW